MSKTQLISAFNGLNQTDNTNGSFMVTGNNMDSKHYPYLAPRNFKHDGTPKELSKAFKCVDSAKIFNKDVEIYQAEYNINDKIEGAGRKTGTNVSTHKKKEFIVFDNQVVPFASKVSDYRWDNVKGNRINRVGTKYLFNGDIELRNDIDGGFFQNRAGFYFAASTFSAVSSGGKYGMKIANDTYASVVCACPCADDKMFSVAREMIDTSDNNKIYSFVYAYENLQPADIDESDEFTPQEYLERRAKENRFTYSGKVAVVLTDDTIPSVNGYISLSTFINDSTYNNYNIYLSNYVFSSEGNFVFGNHTPLSFPYVSIGEVKLVDGVATIVKSTDGYLNVVPSATLSNIITDVVDGYRIFEYGMYTQGNNNGMTKDTFFSIQTHMHCPSWSVGDKVLVTERDSSNMYKVLSDGNVMTIAKIESGAIYFEESTANFSTSKNYYMSRFTHKMDYYCGHKNRLYCYSNVFQMFETDAPTSGNMGFYWNPKTIYISSLGLPHQILKYGTLIDSYAVVDSEQSDCTALVEYNDMVILFKEHAIEKIMGDMPSDYQTYVYDFCGAMAGYDTVRKINERLYYLGSDYNVYCYTGGEPYVISRQLNEFVPGLKLSQNSEWNGKPRLIKQYKDYKTLKNVADNDTCFAYGFEYDGNYYLSIRIKLISYGAITTKTYLQKTLKYDAYLQQWYPADDNAYTLFCSSEESEYNFVKYGENTLHTFNALDVTGNGKGKRINENFNCILSPINMGNMLSKTFKCMRVRFTSLSNEKEDKLNVAYAIDDENFFTVTKVPLSNKSVVEIPIARVGEEVTIGFEGNGIILIKGIEIDYDVQESCK